MSDEINPSTTGETFRSYVAAINRHDTASLASLMTPDYVFIDSLGNQVKGTGAILNGWGMYFAMCPDYEISVTQVLSESDVVVATGVAAGTIDHIAWKTPAAWQATVRHGRIAEWRVFADNKPVYEILNRRAPANSFE